MTSRRNGAMCRSIRRMPCPRCHHGHLDCAAVAGMPYRNLATPDATEAEHTDEAGTLAEA
jgi:hypothetical protein